MLSVSIAMATYNGQKYLQRQLESLAAQSNRPAELVVTDDCSTDDTLSILQKFAECSSFPVRIFSNEGRLGYRENFIRAASLCKADLIAFCDQDDEWYPSKIEVCVSRFIDPEILLVYHNADVVTNDGAQLGDLGAFSTTESIASPLSLSPLRHALGFTQIFRRSLLEMSDLWPLSVDHQFQNERMAHDQWFFFLASILGKIGYIDESLAAYVQHGKNTYGHGAKIGYLKRLRRNFQNPADQLSRRAAAADSRAKILDIAKDRVNGIQSDRAMRAIRNYQTLSELNVARKRIYISTTFASRLRAFLALWNKGGYEGTWALSRRAAIKDMTVGVLFGRHLPSREII